MIKIALIAKNLNINGVSSVVLSLATNLSSNDYKIDIFVGAPISSFNTEKIAKKRNINIIQTPTRSLKNSLKYYGFLKRKLKGYDIVHVHGNSCVIAIDLAIAKLNKNKNTIAHCHNTSCDHKLMHRMLKPFFSVFYDLGLAPTDDCGKWMFGNNKYNILRNGVNTKEYDFDTNKRKSIRSSLNIRENDYVIGHVGNFSRQKNYGHIIKTFDKLCEKGDNYKLLLIGRYQNNLETFKMIKESKNAEKIIIYGATKKPSSLYNAMDCFIFPSLFEGFGIVLLEAQLNGLPCIVSDNIPKEAFLTKDCLGLSLKSDISLWCDSIVKIKAQKKRAGQSDNCALKQYDIDTVVSKLDDIYKKLYRKKKQ